MLKIIKLGLIIICIFQSVGCTAKRSTYSIPTLKTSPAIKTDLAGFYHAVKRGETLWRISRIYSVEMQQIAELNMISDSCKIEVGQKIFIPDSFRKEKKIKQISIHSASFIWPYNGELASCFNQPKKIVKNQGIDIITRPGAAISASEAGNVVFTSSNMRGFGKTIIIEHTEKFSTIYANNQKNLVKAGDYVKQGQTIAYAGSTGRTSRSIVHFELRKNNKAQNPLLYLP